MAVTAHQHDTVVSAPAGALTVANRKELQQQVLDALDHGALRLVVDLAATPYVDSAGLGTLVVLTKRVRARGGDLRLANLHDDVRHVLELTRLDTVLTLDPAERPPVA